MLDKGMVLRMKRDFAGANQALEEAKSEMERLYAASVSENALSFIVNDATVSYAGDDYEQVLVHLYMALNYLELGQPEEARDALEAHAEKAVRHYHRRRAKTGYHGTGTCVFEGIGRSRSSR